MVAVEAFIQLVKLFFHEWWAALLKIQWFTWTNLRECALLVRSRRCERRLLLFYGALLGEKRYEESWRLNERLYHTMLWSGKFPYCVILFGLLKM
jgi:hypothetical protein